MYKMQYYWNKRICPYWI